MTHKHRKSNPSNHDSFSAQWNMDIVHRRMSESPESCHKSPEPPARPAYISQHDEDRHHDKRHCALTLAPQGVGDMSTIELTDGNQIQRRHKQAKPRGESDWVQDDVCLKGNGYRRPARR